MLYLNYNTSLTLVKLSSNEILTPAFTLNNTQRTFTLFETSLHLSNGNHSERSLP